jgi:hypothetical protein
LERRHERIQYLEPFHEADAGGQILASGSQLPLRDEIAVMYRHALPDAPLRLVGNHPAEWQRRLMENLGLLDCYSVIEQPVCFTRVLTSDLLSLHVSYPTRFVRPVFDTLVCSP